MLVLKKRIQSKLSLGVALSAALMFSSQSFAQSVGGVIKGIPAQQSQYSSGQTQQINQNARLLLELQALREELASLRNQVEQQGYQLRQLQQAPKQGSIGGGLSNNQPVINSGLNNSVGTNSAGLASGEIQPNTALNGTTQSAPIANSGAINQAGSVQFPLLPQDQVPQNQIPATAQNGVPAASAAPQRALPQLVPQSGQVAQNLPSSTNTNGNAELSRQAQLLKEGDKGIKTNLNELELYNKGIDKLSAQDYRAAASIFSAQLQNFPKGEKAGDGYFWLAETFYILDDLDSASKSYQSLVDRFPNHVRTPKALLKLIGVHQERKDQISAKIAMNVLVKKYSGTTEANSAKSQYSSLL